MSKPASALSARDLPLGLKEEDPLDVLDLPQLYQKPTTSTLLSTLADLSSAPPSWDGTPRLGTPRSPLSGAATPIRRRRKIGSEGIPSYLTRIIASPLGWIEDDEEKAQIWEAASQRLTERSGRTAMGAITRTFVIPVSSASVEGTNGEQLGAEVESAGDLDDVVEIAIHEPALTADNLGLKTWASSFLLAKRLRILRSCLPPLAPSSSILELGAGTGLVGMAAAAVLKSHVILTDLPEIVPNLERNLHANTTAIQSHDGSGEAAILDWSIPSAFATASGEHLAAHSFPLILAADSIYSSEHPPLFASAVDQHLSRTEEARVVIELPLREAFTSERRAFHDCMTSIGLGVLDQGEEIGYDDWAADGKDDEELAEVKCWWSVWGWRCLSAKATAT